MVIRHGLKASVTACALGLAFMVAAPVSADVKGGVDHWERGDYAAAVAEWRPLAIKGDADAQFNLGQAYKLGRGVPMDLAQAEIWYRRAAEQGHLQAEDNLGLVLFTANKRDEAMPYIKRAAARGEPRAQYVLGTAHFNGDLADKDWPRAYALVKRASDAGLGVASSRLGQLDQMIPLEQRQRGIAMAAELERSEQQVRMAAATGGPVAPALPSTIRPADLPASTPGVQYTPPPMTPGVVTPTVKTPPVIVTPTRPAAPTVVVAAPVVAPVTASGGVRTKAGGKWRVQLGAFSTQARAEGLWTSLERRYPALTSAQPFLVKAGAVTRLQAGEFSSKADADALCKIVAPSGQACFAMAK